MWHRFKPNNSGNDSSSSKTSQGLRGSMTDIKVTLRFLILQAYELPGFYVVEDLPGPIRLGSMLK